MSNGSLINSPVASNISSYATSADEFPSSGDRICHGSVIVACGINKWLQYRKRGIRNDHGCIKGNVREKTRHFIMSERMRRFLPVLKRINKLGDKAKKQYVKSVTRSLSTALAIALKTSFAETFR